MSWKDYKAVTTGLKAIYQAPTEELALMALDAFCEAWDGQYPRIGESWRTHWPNICTIFGYPSDIRHAIYTTNAIESLNSVIRHATKKRKIFSSDDSARKVIYLAVMSASKKWELLSNLVYGIQAAFSVDCSSSCLPSLKMTLLTTKVNKLNP